MRRVMLLGALALVLAGCSMESALPSTDVAPFKNDPTVTVALAAINGGDVTVNLTLTNFKLTEPASAAAAHTFGEGHVHLFLDVPPTAPGEVTPHAPGIYHVTESNYTIHGVKDGHHRLVAVLGFSDHLPYGQVGQRGETLYGAISAITFTTGAGQTQVTAAAPSAAPSTAPSSQASAPAASGGGPTIRVVADASNGGAYNPGDASVSVGGTVTWVWEDDSASHTVTADNNNFDSGLQGKGFKYTQTFKSAGTFKYHCSVHPNMVGTVKVQ